jgi:hypothetical protein
MTGRRSFLMALIGAPLVKHIPIAPEPKLCQSFYSMRVPFEFPSADMFDKISNAISSSKLSPISERDYRIPFKFQEHGGL